MREAGQGRSPQPNQGAPRSVRSTWDLTPMPAEACGGSRTRISQSRGRAAPGRTGQGTCYSQSSGQGRASVERPQDPCFSSIFSWDPCISRGRQPGQQQLFCFPSERTLSVSPDFGPVPLTPDPASCAAPRGHTHHTPMAFPALGASGAQGDRNEETSLSSLG